MFKVKESLIANAVKVECAGITVYEDSNDYSEFVDQAYDVAAYHAKLRIAEIFKSIITNEDQAKILSIETEYSNTNCVIIHIYCSDKSCREFKTETENALNIIHEKVFIGRTQLEFVEYCEKNGIELY